MARNVYAREAKCTRDEAALVLSKVSDEACEELARATSQKAKAIVGEVMRLAAEAVIASQKKQPSQIARGLNPRGGSHGKEDNATAHGAESGLRTGGEPGAEDSGEGAEPDYREGSGEGD